MKTAALFDLDGVIVDTEPRYTEFWEVIGRDYFPGDSLFAQKIKGHTLTYILEKYFPQDVQTQQKVMDLLKAHQRQMAYPYIPGVMAFVARLREQGVGVAVVTSSDLEKMACLYKEHPEFPTSFDRIFTAEDALRSKPAPDCYCAAAHYFGLEASQCVVFEDSFNGLEAGRASGARVVGLSTSNRAECIASYCDSVIPDFQNVEQLLRLF